MRIIFIIYYLLITLLFVSCQESSSVEVEREKIASLLQKGDSCRQVGNEENSIAFYYRSLELAKQTGEQSLEAAASDRLGIVYLYRELYYDVTRSKYITAIGSTSQNQHLQIIFSQKYPAFIL